MATDIQFIKMADEPPAAATLEATTSDPDVGTTNGSMGV